MSTGFRRQIRAALTAMVLIVLSGCGGGIPIVSEGKASQGYTDAQNMLIIATERNRYQDVYTDQIWKVEVDDEGNTFQNYLLKEIQEFLKKLRTTNLLADERGISPTGQEQERLNELTDQFYATLTEADLSYTGVTREDVYAMYEAYYRANRLVDEVTKEVNLEISDSEAKVITVQEIAVRDEETAQAVYEQVTAEKADFEAIAKHMSEGKEITKLIGRGEHPMAYEMAVFELEAGQVSSVLEVGDSYYIVKCIDDYDEDATLQRKEKLALQRKNLAFREIYDTFAAEHLVDIGGTFWEKVSFAEGEDSTTTGFFDLYQEYMKQ